MNKIYEDYISKLDISSIKAKLNEAIIAESGLRNMNDIGKNYDKAVIYYHMDLDGITSAIAMREYLKRYNIELVGCSLTQYGDFESQSTKSIEAFKHAFGDDVLFVLVDFAQGNIGFNIHTDHHLTTYVPDEEKTTSDTTPAPSNVDTISGTISPSDIFTSEDMNVINMVDSARWAVNDIKLDDMTKVAYKFAQDESIAKNKAFLGIGTYKLIDVMKTKTNQNYTNYYGGTSYKKVEIGSGDGVDYIINEVVMNANPSLISIYSHLVKGANKVGVDVSGLKTQYENFAVYNQKAGQVFKVDHKDLKNPQDLFHMLTAPLPKNPKGTKDATQDIVVTDTVIINKDVVVPKEWLWGKEGIPQAKYNRYLPFKANENADFILKYFSGLPMIQCSSNPFKEDRRVKDLEEVGNSAIEKYSTELKSMKINLIDYNKYLQTLFEKKPAYTNIKRSTKKSSWGPNLDGMYVNKEFIDSMKEIMLYKGEPITDDVVSALFAMVDGSYEPKNRKLYGHEIDTDEIMKDTTIDFYSYSKKYSGGHKQIYNVQLAPVTPEFIDTMKDKEMVTQLKRVSYQIMYYMYHQIR